MQVWIWNPTVVRVLTGTWTMSDSWVISHKSWLHLQPHPRYALLLPSSWFPSIIGWKLNLHQVIKCISEDHAGLDILWHCYWRVRWCMDHVRQVWDMPWVLDLPSATSQTCSSVILAFRSKLNTAPPPGEELVKWGVEDWWSEHPILVYLRSHNTARAYSLFHVKTFPHSIGEED